MKLFLLILLSAAPAFAQNFTYSETPQFKKPSPATTLLFEHKLSQQGFIPLEQSGMGDIPFLNMDQVFEKDDQVIFFKQGLKPSKRELIGKVISISNGFVFHGVTAAEIPFALFFKGIQKSQVEALLGRMDMLSSSKVSWYSLLIPRACASVDDNCDLRSSNYASLVSVSNFIDPLRLQTLMMSCMISALNGVVEGAKDIANTIHTLFTNPAKLWNDTVAKFEQLKDFVLNIKPRVLSFIQSLRDMDAEMIAEIVCPIVGSVGVKMLVGGGVAAATALLMQKFLSVQKLSGVLGKLARLKRSGNQNVNALTNKVIACAR